MVSDFDKAVVIVLRCQEQYPCKTVSLIICRRPGFDPWVRNVPWRRERQPTPVFWPGEFHGLSSPWSNQESTRLSDFHFVTLVTLHNKCNSLES